jgi:hypothetical protein
MSTTLPLSVREHLFGNDRALPQRQRPRLPIMGTAPSDGSRLCKCAPAGGALLDISPGLCDRLRIFLAGCSKPSLHSREGRLQLLPLRASDYRFLGGVARTTSPWRQRLLTGSRQAECRDVQPSARVHLSPPLSSEPRGLLRFVFSATRGDRSSSRRPVPMWRQRRPLSVARRGDHRRPAACSARSQLFSRGALSPRAAEPTSM